MFHKRFKINGSSFNTVNELLDYSHKLSEESNQFLENWFSKKNTIQVKTSGSTGVPKVIEIGKQQMINSALSTGEYFNLPAGTTALLCMPVKFIAGKMMLIRAMVLGWEMDIVTPTTNPLDKCNKMYDFSAMVPLQLYHSLDKIHRIKKVIIGGGVVSNSLATQLENIPTQLYATYGMTETVTHIAVRKLNQFSNLSEKNSYQTLPNVQINTDSRGCLVIDAPKVCTQKVYTNDVVKLISSTEFEWLGRFDSIINSGGIKIQPEQVEKKMSTLISERFFISSIADDKLGEKVILLIEKSFQSAENKKQFELTIKEKLQHHSSLEKYEHPKEILFVNQFIETPTQKIQRKKTVDYVVSLKKII